MDDKCWRPSCPDGLRHCFSLSTFSHLVLRTRMYLFTMQLFCACLRLSITSVMDGRALVVLIMTARYPSATAIRKLGENKGLLPTGPGNYTATQRVLGPGLLLLLGLRVGPRVSQARSLLVNLKHKSRKGKKKKKQVAQMVSYWNQPRSLKRGASVREAVWLSIQPCGWLCVYRQPSLKWMPRRSESKSGTCIAKQKRQTETKNCLGLHYINILFYSFKAFQNAFLNIRGRRGHIMKSKDHPLCSLPHPQSQKLPSFFFFFCHL